MFKQGVWFGLVGLLLLVVGLSACTGGGSEAAAEPEEATVNGRLLDSYDIPVVDGFVRVSSDLIETRTDTDGRFSFSITAGAHQLVASKDGLTLAVLCFTAAEGVIYDLGDIKPGMPSNCDSALPTAGDADGDGLLDIDETAGWPVNIVLGDGTIETREVNSDPALYDTDGDGLNDAQEMAARTDPRRMDTDGDLLSDYAEFYVYKSHPTRMDSDGDSCDPDSPEGECYSDPNLWDGYELALSKTSPTLADTDGDGFSDYQEINIGGTSPNLANLPSLALELNGDPLIELNMELNVGSEKLEQELTREETNRVRTDNESTKMSIENTIDIRSHTEVGTSAWPPSFKATIDTQTKFQHGYFHDTSSSWKQSSVEESQANYNTWETENVSFDDGKLGVAMKVVNESDLSFKLKDLLVVAYRQTGGGRFSLIGTMAPDEEWPAEGFVLGPSSEITLTMSKQHIGAEVMRALVKDPTALMFEVGAYSLFQLDEWGVNETVNYAVLGEDVLQRTGLIVLDYGDGRVERHMVATNVYRNPDGSGRGVTLREALHGVVGLDYEVKTETLVDTEGNESSGLEVLYRVKNVISYDVCNKNSDAYDPVANCETLHKQGFWHIAGTGLSFDEGVQINFDDATLHNGERVSLTYIEDSDGDGVFNREEYLLGSRRDVADTDGDTLSDYDETRVGWEVAVVNMTPYEVFPDPRFSDFDGDFLSDVTEFSLGTDPYLKNTDGDEQDDTTDPFPLSPPCLLGDKLGMMAWWDGSNRTAIAEDIWFNDPVVVMGDVASDGEMFGGDLTIDILGDLAFQFNPFPDQNSQYIDVPNQLDDGLSPLRELTFSTWIYWEGVATGREWGTVLSKGEPNVATYALSINPEGQLKFSMYRNAHLKCWFWLFGWVDNLCKDSNININVELLTDFAITPQQWVNVTATFSGETMSLYLDGVLSKYRSTYSPSWTSGSFKYQATTTNFLLVNDDPLRIGGEYINALPELPFRGLMDDIQVFARGLNEDEVGQMSRIGVCTP